MALTNKDVKYRMGLTLLIWFSLLAVSLISIMQVGEDGTGFIFLLGVAAVFVNGFIWNWGQGLEGQTQAAEKAKRGEGVQRLVDLMDEDELYELRRRLEIDYSDSPKRIILGDDGELLEDNNYRS